LTFASEEVIGYFQSVGLRRSSKVYVTTERIIVNKGKGQLHLTAHMLIAFLVLIGSFVVAMVAIIILLLIAAIITFVVVQRRRYRRSRRKWPSIKEVEEGIRYYEVRKNQVVSIDLRRPATFRSGYVRIRSFSDEINLKIAGKRVFNVASNLMTRFEPNRVRVD
jgi:hypothetical protein